MGQVHAVSLVCFDDRGRQVSLVHPEKYISTEIINTTTGNTVQGW
jgi:hypothetical protein